MSKPKTIHIDNVEYVRADSVDKSISFNSTNLKIVVVDRSWNFIGNIELTENSIIITNAKVIRKWGTTKGLGQLAISGPTTNTILDDVGTVTIPLSALIFTIDVDSSKW